MTCSKCHHKGHKSNKCPQPRKKLSDEKNKKKLTIKSSLIYTKPNRRNKSNSTSYVIKKKTNGKVVAHKVGKARKKLEPPHLGAQGYHHQYEGASNGVGSKGDLKPKKWCRGIWRLSLQVEVKVQAKEAKLNTWSFVAQVPHKLEFNSSIM